jgi:hypothetical protein
MFFPPLLLANIEEKVIFLAWRQNEILSICPRVLVKGMICLEIKVRSIFLCLIVLKTCSLQCLVHSQLLPSRFIVLE